MGKREACRPTGDRKYRRAMSSPVALEWEMVMVGFFDIGKITVKRVKLWAYVRKDNTGIY